MESLLNNIFSALEITLLDIVLSGDNMGIIALAVRKLPPKQAKIANMVGVAGAILLRIFFASIVTTLLLVEWIPVKLVGGLLLLKITWNIIDIKETSSGSPNRSSSGFWRAVYNIILADFSVSLDNVLAIGGVAKGNIVLIVFGLLLNIPIIFFGSQLVGKLITKYKITAFIGAGVLVHTALEMILEDKIIYHYVSRPFTEVFPWLIALIIIFYGIYVTRKGNNKRY